MALDHQPWPQEILCCFFLTTFDHVCKMTPDEWLELEENLGPLRTTLHTSQGPWPCSYEGPWFSSKSRTNDMVCYNLRHACLLKVNLVFLANHETKFFYSPTCRKSFKLFTHDSFLGPLGLHLLVWSELGRSKPFRPMRDLTMQWSCAFSLVCEVAFIGHSVCTLAPVWVACGHPE